MIVTSLAWVVGVLLIEAASVEPALSCSGLALAGWITIAGLPRSARRAPPVAGSASGARCPVLLTLAIVLAPLALAVRLDRVAGASWSALTSVCAMGLLLIAILVGAAESARASARSSRYAASWLTLVVGLPVLASALGAGAGWPRESVLTRVAAASPAAWAWQRAELAALESRALPYDAIPALVIALLLLLAAGRGR